MSALNILFGLVAWVAYKPRPQLRAFHSGVAETGNRRMTVLSVLKHDCTLRHISAVRHLCTYCNRNTYIRLFRKRLIYGETVVVTQSDKQTAGETMAFLTQQKINSRTVRKQQAKQWLF
jgi:hypothetical protein